MLENVAPNNLAGITGLTIKTCHVRLTSGKSREVYAVFLAVIKENEAK